MGAYAEELANTRSARFMLAAVVEETGLYVVFTFVCIHIFSFSVPHYRIKTPTQLQFLLDSLPTASLIGPLPDEELYSLWFSST